LSQSGRRRRSTHTWISLVAAALFFIAGLASVEYGGVLPYATATLLAVAQAVKPTRPGYMALLFITTTSALLLSYLIATDLVRVSRGRSALLFLDHDDTVAVVILWLAVSALPIALYYTRPLRKPATGSAG
jgi:hypothetical protein